MDESMIDPNLLNSVFDAVLIGISEKPVRCALFMADDLQYWMRLPHPLHWQLDVIGVLRFDDEGICRRFVPYPDQRLRRAPAHDDVRKRRWGWAIEGHTFSVRAGLVPGLTGAVVQDACRPLEVPIPPEFVQLCEQHHLEPMGLLRAFIADLAGITDSRLYPREDGYCSGGVEERFFANEYFVCAYRCLQQQPQRSQLTTTAAPELAWLNQLAQRLPDMQQQQMAEILDLARYALCALGHMSLATVGIQDIDIALEGLPITSITS